MNKLFFSMLLTLSIVQVTFSQSNIIDTIKVKQDFEKIISKLETKYVYYNKKDVDLDCLKKHYNSKISSLKNKTEVLLFFEYLLDEFYDSHLHLNTNNNHSFRLYSPIYVSTKGKKTIISSYWKSQIENNININLINAEVLTFNGIEFNKVIENFPTHCQNKNNNEIRTWLSNKIFAGRHNEPRIVTIKTALGKIETFDLDKIILKTEVTVITSFIQDNIGIIRINNSLGRIKTKKKFTKALKKFKNTKGIIIDLRNTVDGGSTNIANPIAGHFTNKKRIFQKYRNRNTQFVDYIKPQKPYYEKPLVVLVGRWTGSMGEGLASGFDGTEIGKIIGTKMLKLAGATKNYSFKYLNYGYQMPYIDVLHIDGYPREKYVPKYTVQLDDTNKDEFILQGIKIINEFYKK